MRKTIAVVALLVLVCGLAVVGSVLAANGYLIRRSVIGGGGRRATGGSSILKPRVRGVSFVQ